jgi:hypothetical protein
MCGLHQFVATSSLPHKSVESYHHNNPLAFTFPKLLFSPGLMLFRSNVFPHLRYSNMHRKSEIQCTILLKKDSAYL